MSTQASEVVIDLRGTSPRPWFVQRTKFAGLADGMNYVTVHNGFISICKMTGSEGMQVDEVPDASLIVRAVNCHDELVKALLPFSFCDPVTPPAGVLIQDWGPAVLAARDAVKKAQAS